MMKNINKNLSLTALIIIAAMFISMFAVDGPALAKDIEEDANMVLTGDNVITGRMDEYSNNTITVDHVRRSLCKNARVFGPGSNLVDIKDIGAAIEVKLFINNSCVRKIKVLSFAQ